jgi:predicted mannosyl-3-phosphoglycerate phosphatase (HAD superfamily)
VPLVALDMDGTLLDSSSNITPESAEVIRAAAAAGVNVILATGKARPAAIAAARKAKLEGDALLVSHSRPGVFLQVWCQWKVWVQCMRCILCSCLAVWVCMYGRGCCVAAACLNSLP